MQITSRVPSEKNTDFDSDDSTRAASTCNGDACFFTSLLEPASTASAFTGGTYISPAMAEAVAPLKDAKKRMTTLLRSANQELDIEKFRKFPSMLSNIQLTSQLLVKCLAKTTQGIEKISNLQ
ncbi:EscI/YscI/HrpB family type III secretion system inner rod protein [Pseudomonas orientalis]|uniref:Type III secretion basal body protein I, YscI, HrpB, PscI n=1 Tax=Pseudomonas orientalis TaxID=76758 RepID=A0A1H2H8Y3_9PSED|nr:EscI/YscI/HrpB family type III secretion system inner rod protein [Pseudomonas orientalis]KRP61124.1 hypothetical protein TU82_24985 [Pseudomonas orientalis]SDU28341.1 Type III secretion basal body protein I, YscI, HrpB, PscI [Pseudomonas orientalis]